MSFKVVSKRLVLRRIQFLLWAGLPTRSQPIVGRMVCWYVVRGAMACRPSAGIRFATGFEPVDVGVTGWQPASAGLLYRLQASGTRDTLLRLKATREASLKRANMH